VRNIYSLLGAPIGLGTGDPKDGMPGTGKAGPRGIESVIEYNGLYLNVRDWIDTYLVTTIGGLDDADIRDNRDVNPGFHGETAFQSFYGGRTITLTGKVYCKSLFKLRDMQQALRQAFAQLDDELPLIFRTPDPSLDMMIYAKKSQPIQMADEQRTANHFERAFQITLRASNPRFVSVTNNYSYVSFSDLYDFSVADQVTVENFASPGVLNSYNERGHGFVVVNSDLVYDTSLPADNFVNLVKEPDLDEVTAGTSAVTAVNANLTFASSGGALDDGKCGVLTAPVAAPFVSMYWPVDGITPGAAYSGIGYLRSQAMSRQGWLMVEWLNSSNAVIGTQYTEVMTTGAWQEVRLQGAVAPAGAAKSRWHLRFFNVTAGEVHYGDKMLVVQSQIFPPEGYFDGSNTLASWTDLNNKPISGSTSKLPRYSILTTTKSFDNGMQVVKFTTPATLPSPRAAEIRLVMGYIDDNNQVYIHISDVGPSGPPPDGRLFVSGRSIIGGVESDLTGSGDFLLDPSTTYWFIGYVKDDYIHGEVTDLDPYTRTVSYTNADRHGGFYFALPPQLKSLYSGKTPMQLVVAEKGARIPIDTWTYQSLDAPSGWEVKFIPNRLPETVWVRNGKLYPLGSQGPLIVRKDLAYNVGDGRVTTKVRVDGLPVDSNTQWGIGFKVVDEANFLSALIFYTASATPAIQMSIYRTIDGSLGSQVTGPTNITAADFPQGVDRWLSVVTSGDQITFEFWKTDPVLGGAATATLGPYTLTSTNKTKFGAGIKGQVGIHYDRAKEARAITFDDLRVSQPSFTDIAFVASNDGNFRAQPEIHLIGPMTNPVIVNEANDERITITTTVPNGEHWVIDTAGRRMYRVSDQANRFQYLDVNSDWMELEPGENPISLTASGMTLNSQMNVYFRHTVM
jgi:hypothetical protein